jgi:hypothetical protein
VVVFNPFSAVHEGNEQREDRCEYRFFHLYNRSKNGLQQLPEEEHREGSSSGAAESPDA